MHRVRLTLDEYRKYIEKDGALERRFQQIVVEAPNREETILILKGLRDRYEAHHRVQITDSALFQAVELSDRYITGRVQPDKSIDVIDEAGAAVRLKTMTKPPNLAELERDIERLIMEKDEAVKNADYERAAELRDKAEVSQPAKTSCSASGAIGPRRWTALSMTRPSRRSYPASPACR